MKRLMVLMACSLVLMATAAAVIETSRAETVNATAISSLPLSLDKLYPPQARGPVWLISMIEMGTSFSGIITDFMEGDFSQAERGYADFRVQYGKLAEMIPEWAGDLPGEPIDALGPALESRDIGVFMPAADRVSGVCHGCHVKNMTVVQQKYHWGDFQSIALTDPVSNADVTFPGLMRFLEGDLSGIQVDLAQDQVDRAREHANGLAARYAALEESCEACHDTKRHYYVDASIMEMIEQLRAVLGGPTADSSSVQKLVQGIGMESCHNCHLVHGPAALARYASASGEH